MDPKEFSPMLAAPVSLDKLSKYDNYTMEVKLDGVRCLAVKEPNGRLTMWTRQGNEISDKLPYLRNQLKSIVGAFVLDGELGYVLRDENNAPYAIDFNKTMRVIGSSPDVAWDKQMGDHPTRRIKFTVFDILQKGNWPTWRDSQYNRRLSLVDLVESLARDDTPDIEITYSWDTFEGSTYERILSLGGEGVMLKNPEAQYHMGKRRANTWYKVKGFDTIDCKIVNYDPGKGKYTGQVGALVVTDPQGNEIRVSGMNDQARHDMTQHFENYNNKMIEVKYFGKVGINQDGYRHPQFLRMRPDLDAS